MGPIMPQRLGPRKLLQRCVLHQSRRTRALPVPSKLVDSLAARLHQLARVQRADGGVAQKGEDLQPRGESNRAIFLVAQCA